MARPVAHLIWYTKYKIQYLTKSWNAPKVRVLRKPLWTHNRAVAVDEALTKPPLRRGHGETC